MAVGIVAVVAAYLLGGIPFGYLVGRLRGVNLLAAGSGNIGATNAGRVLGRPFAVLVFVCDFAKGAVPTALTPPVVTLFDPGAADAFGPPDALRVAVAAATFLGHLYPVFLGFRGGKGVATGAGVAAALAPLPWLLAAVAWAITALASRYVSLASLTAAVTLVAARLAVTPDPFGRDALVVTGFFVVGALAVVAKHRANVRRLLAGTENRIGANPPQEAALRSLHLLAVGVWFGGSLFFNFAAAPAIFTSFKAVVAESPSDRTAMLDIVPPGTPQAAKDALASALAGAAVGPIFPRYFTMQLICGAVALVTALSMARAGGVHRLRAGLAGVAFVLVVASVPVSAEVSRLRLERFNPDGEVAARAKSLFGPVHLVSLTLSAATTLLAGAVLALGARLPAATSPTRPSPPPQSP